MIPRLVFLLLVASLSIPVIFAEAAQDISITSILPTNQQGQHISHFTKGSTGYLKVTLESNTVKESLVTISVFGDDLTPLGISSVKTKLQRGQAEYQISYKIPPSAQEHVNVYANILSNWPSQGGVPLSDETHKSIKISDTKPMVLPEPKPSSPVPKQTTSQQPTTTKQPTTTSTPKQPTPQSQQPTTKQPTANVPQQPVEQTHPSARSVTVSTNKQSYVKGDIVSVTGTVNGVSESVYITITFFDPFGNQLPLVLGQKKVMSHQFPTASDGRFFPNYFPEQLPLNSVGTYAVVASHGSLSSRVTFQVTETQPTPQPAPVPTPTQPSQRCAGSSITLDKSSYALDEGFYVTIVSPDANTNPNAQDRVYIGGRTQANDKSAIGSPYWETGPNTGVFRHFAELEPHYGNQANMIHYHTATYPNTLIVEYKDPCDGTTKTVTASITAPVGTVPSQPPTTPPPTPTTQCYVSSVEFDQKIYSSGDALHITVVAPNANKNPSSKDQITINLQSSSRSITKSLSETGTNTGIFTISVQSTELVSSGSSSITAIYHDSCKSQNYQATVTVQGSTTQPPPTTSDPDGDGVTGTSDQCPNSAGPASNNGCPVQQVTDTDNDGVPDTQDQCDTSPGPASNNGCPVQQVVSKTKFVNKGVHPIVSMKIDGIEQFNSAGGGISPNGGWAEGEFSSGSHSVSWSYGYWSGSQRQIWYGPFSGTFVQPQGTTHTEPIEDFRVNELLTRFQSNGFWEAGCVDPVNYTVKGFAFRFYLDGSFRFYVNGQQTASGTYWQTSRNAGSTSFQLNTGETSTIFEADNDSFYMFWNSNICFPNQLLFEYGGIS